MTSRLNMPMIVSVCMCVYVWTIHDCTSKTDNSNDMLVLLGVDKSVMAPETCHSNLSSVLCCSSLRPWPRFDLDSRWRQQRGHSDDDNERVSVLHWHRGASQQLQPLLQRHSTASSNILDIKTVSSPNWPIY